MSVYSVSNATQLQSALSKAKGGDTILLAGGNYGDVVIASRSYSSAVTITSANPEAPATFHSIVAQNSSNLTFSHIAVDLKPTATSAAWTTAFKVVNSSSITLSDSKLTGGLAINGVDPSATALDATGNVKGYPSGFGVTLIGSTGVTLSNNALSTFSKGITGSVASNVTISGNSITAMRQSDISIGGLTDAVISNNFMSQNDPWAWNQSYGDHGDVIHLWTIGDAGSKNVSITGNVYRQGTGTAILGINLEGKPGTPGFSDVTIANNAIDLGNAQGFRLQNIANSTIVDNLLTSPAGAKSSPGILFASMADGSPGTNNTVTGNIVGSITWQSSLAKTSATVFGNIISQQIDPYGPNYVSPTQLSSASSASSMYSIVKNALPGQTVQSTYSETAANILANMTTIKNNAAIATVIVTDSQPMVLTVAQWQSDSQVLAKLKNANGSPVSVIISDKAATLATSLDALGADGTITSVLVSDNQRMTLSADTVASDAALIAKISNANGSAFSYSVSDTAASISANFGTLASAQGLYHLLVSDSNALQISVSDYLSGSSLLNKLSGAASIAVLDTGANVSSDLARLGASMSNARHFTSITVSDSKPVTMTFCQYSSFYGWLSSAHDADGTSASFAIRDTAANIKANLYTVGANSKIGSATITDGATLSLTATQFNAYGSGLSKLTGAHTVQETNVTGKTYNAVVFDYGAAGDLLSQRFSNNDGTESVVGLASGAVLNSSSHFETIEMRATGETLRFDRGMQSEVVNGFVAGADTLDFAWSLFSSPSAALHSLTTDSHGNAVLHVGDSSTITLNGVSTASLTAHASSTFAFHSG